MGDVFDNLIASGTPANVLAATDTVSNLARNKAPNLLKKDGRITQTERLLTARARYAQDSNAYEDGTGADSAGSRGTWAYIKLLTSDVQRKEYGSKNTKRAVVYKDLLGHDGIVSKMARDDEGYGGLGYDGFLLTNISCDMNEKVQITEVFGDGEVVYYFGRQPIIFNLSGILIDSPDNNWFVDWLKTYSEFLRGSQAARNHELIKIVLPNMSIIGTISGFSWRQDSNRDVDIPFSFQFIAKRIEPAVTYTGPVVRSNLLRGVNFTKASLLSMRQINSVKTQVASLTATITNPRSSLRDRSLALTQLGSGAGGALGIFLEDSKNTLNGFQTRIDGWNKSTSNKFDQVRSSALFQTVTASLIGIRSNLFSPVYGILSSLTKLISNTANSASGIFNSFINPVRNILRDITSISKQAIAVVNLVNSRIAGFGRNVNNQLRGVETDFKTAIKTLGKAAGVIAAAPITAAQTAKDMFDNGRFSSSTAFLVSRPRSAFLRPSLLITKNPPIPIINFLVNTPQFTPANAGQL